MKRVCEIPASAQLSIEVDFEKKYLTVEVVPIMASEPVSESKASSDVATQPTDE